MKNIICAGLVGLALALAGSVSCGGGSDANAQEYFDKLQALDDASEARQTELRTAYDAATAGMPEGGEPTPELITAVKTYYEGLVETGKDFVNAADDLSVPRSAKDEHEEFIAAYDDVLAEFNTIIDNIDNVTTSAEFNTLTSGPAVAAVFDRANSACAALQQAAVDADATVDLECRT